MNLQVGAQFLLRSQDLQTLGFLIRIYIEESSLHVKYLLLKDNIWEAQIYYHLVE